MNVPNEGKRLVVPGADVWKFKVGVGALNKGVETEGGRIGVLKIFELEVVPKREGVAP